MSISWMHLLGYLLAIIPYVFFMNHYLTPKYSKRWTTLLSSMILLITIVITIFTMFDKMIGKLIISLCSIYFIILCLYDGTLIKKIISPIIMVTGIVVVELPLDYILIYLLKWDMNLVMENSFLFLLLQCVLNLTNLFLFKTLIYLLNKEIHVSRRYIGIYLIFSIQFFAVIYLVNQIPFMTTFHMRMEKRIYYIVIMLLIDIGTNIFMMIYLHSLYKKTKTELSIELLEKEYRRILKEYQETNKEAYQYLRHDIMNYLMKQENLKGDLYEKYD